MEPNSFARKLGIGVRLASRQLRARVRTAPAAASYSSPAQAKPRPVVQQAAKKTRNVARASKRFGEAIWGPLAHAGGVLWLEVTGLFFTVFALFFVESAYRLRAAYSSGPEHARFLVYAALMVVFFYFAFSSFYRSYRKGKRHRR